MSDIKKVTKLWASWNSEKIEEWLENMEAQGWHLVAMKCLGHRMHFKKGAPQKIRYCVDYQSKKNVDYESLCLEAGWKCELSASDWYVWSMPYTNERPAIYTDVDSLIDRNKRLISMIYLAMFAQIPLFTINVTNDHTRPFVMVLYVILFGLFLVGILQLGRSNRKLRTKMSI